MPAELSARRQAPEQTHWIPLADLMTGLMMVFLLIAITYMVKVEAASQHIREIAILYERMKVELYDDLKREFERDLPRWGAEIDEDSTIRFKEPDVLFSTGSRRLIPLSQVDQYLGRAGRIRNGARFDFFGRS